MAPFLSSDIIDCLFTSLPDFATLFSTILVSKSFHEVFQAHPRSILTSVTTTQIGPELLPCAIRLAHFNSDEYLASRTKYVQDFPSERKFSQKEAQPVIAYVAALAKNDRVATELEILFSIRCKDRTSGARSLLNPRESLRFRRAFYRWWLTMDLFPACYVRPTRTAGKTEDEGNDSDDSDEDDTDDDNTDDDDANYDDDNVNPDAPGVYIGKSQDLRKKFLSEFSDDDVADMWQIHNFMVFASSCARNATPDPAILDHFIWNGPAAAAEALRAIRSFNEPKIRAMEQVNRDYRYPDNIWPGFFNYLQEKSYDTSKVGNNTWLPVPDNNVILDSRVEATEECDECYTPYLGPHMWSSSNWHLLPCAVTLHEVLGGLPGRLGWNTRETQQLSATPWSCISFVDRYVSPGVPDWSEGKLLCRGCVLKLMGRHVLNSLRELKAQNETQLEDCWYGYNCRTQRRDNHAVKLNHLCDPSRGD